MYELVQFFPCAFLMKLDRILAIFGVNNLMSIPGNMFKIAQVGTA